MAADFSIRVDPIANMVRITMAGFFDEDDMRRFVVVQAEAYKKLTSAPNQHVTLVDMRDMQIQSQESVTGFRERLMDRKVASRRIAFIVSRSLARMQIARVVDGLTAALFTSEDEAVAWLLDGEEGQI